MIEATSFLVCDHTLALSRCANMQCFIYQNRDALLEKTIAPLLDQWDAAEKTKQPSLRQFSDAIVASRAGFLEALQYLFWDNGEEIPYNELFLMSQLTQFLQDPSILQTLDYYCDQALDAADSAYYEYENRPSSYLSGNTLTIGFGLGGALMAGLTNAGLSAIDYGIGRMADRASVKKFENQINTLLNGKDIKRDYTLIVMDLVDTGCIAAMVSIAENMAESLLFESTHSDWNPRRPNYATLSLDEKIHQCILRLSSNPLHIELYQELMFLTNGQDESVIAFGDAVFGNKVGSQLCCRMAKSRYDIAAKMPETSIAEIDAKTLAVEQALSWMDASPGDDKLLQSLHQLQAYMQAYQLILRRKADIHHTLKCGGTVKPMTYNSLYIDLGWDVFAQECFYMQNPGHALPSLENAEYSAKNGNGLPLLLIAEQNYTQCPEPIDLWTHWAKQGNPYALLRLGLCRLHGSHINKDKLRAHLLIKRAANLCYPPAMHLLMLMQQDKYYPKSGGLKKDEKDNYEVLLAMMEIPSSDFSKYLNFGKPIKSL